MAPDWLKMTADPVYRRSGLERVPAKGRLAWVRLMSLDLVGQRRALALAHPTAGFLSLI